MAAYVQCRQIVKAYRVAQHEIVALRGIDFALERGEMVAIIGPSGAGKSSLLNLLGGLDTPTAGQLIVDGQNLLELNAHGLAKYRLHRVGFLWQQVERNLVSYRSVLRNVTLPMALAGVPLRQRAPRARELLAAVGIDDQARKHPAQLSGGQQQRVAFAVALANQPPLLLADEPTGALDRESSRQVMDLLDNLRERFGLTVLMTTHDMSVAARADRVLTLRDGALGQDITDLAGASADDERGLKPDEEGRIRLPTAVLPQLNGGRLAVEIRPEGVLLRPEADEGDDIAMSLRDMLPQDAPPERNRRRLARLWPFRWRRAAK